MNYFHLNLGLTFSHPYESHYAMVRRCLIANPGISFLTIQANLRISNPKHGSIGDRLRSLQPLSNQIEITGDSNHWQNYQRQCPQCAQNLYHTDIYALPWLTHCPLHHCAFTTHCPVCHQTWPEIKDLAKRACPGCGMLTLEQLRNSVMSSENIQSYRPIANIYDLINHHDSEHSPYFNDRFDLHNEWQKWWMNVPVTAAQFPSFQARHHPDFSTSKLHSLNIPTYKIHCATTKLLPVDYLEENKLLRQRSQIGLNDTIYENFNKTAQNRLMADFTVMQHIVSWISQQTSHNHQIHIATYRYLNMANLMNGPDPCPYCLAFSLWFFHTFARQYGDKMAIPIHDYPFCSQGRTYDFYSGCEPYVIVGSDYFTVDRNFATSFYRRGLEISFLDILYFAFDLLRQLHNYRKNSNNSNLSPYDNIEISDCFYCADLTDDQLYFYYENEHPLDTYVPVKIPEIHSLCSNYQKHHEKHKLDCNKVIIGKIPKSKLTYQAFLSLHKNFREFLQCFWHSYYYSL